MTQFDQRYQQVETQYNADHITIQQQSLSLTEKQRKQNRTRMLERVQTIWISGVLEPSVQGAAQIALELQNKPSAIVTPLWQVLREFDQTGPLPSTETSIVQVYDRAGGEVLILGEPGAGKTTLLLELTRDLLERARQDENHPMPVAFNLSSWATMRQPLTAWLVAELHSKYQVPHALAASWIETDQVLPLLDGLDEITVTHRAACVEAINTYRRVHGLLPTVVCSRLADYLALSTRLLLRTAVVVQPLTPEQIDMYLTSTGEQMVGVRRALQEDADLHTLASTPLMLNVLTVAYQGTPSERISATDTPGIKREQLFAAYVQRMLSRRETSTHATREQTIHWLCRLASQMRRQSQTVFYIEQMQSDWLSGAQVLQAYRSLAVWLPGVLMGILVSVAISGLFLSLSTHADFAESILLGGLLGGILHEERATQLYTTTGKKAGRILGPLLLQCLLTSVLIGLGIGLGWGLQLGLNSGLGEGLSYGLCSLLLQVLLGKRHASATPFQTLPSTRSARWQHFIRSTSIRNGVLVGLLVWLAYALSNGLSNGLSFGPRIGLMQGLSLGLGNGLHSGLSYGLMGGLLSLLAARSTIVQPIDRLIWSPSSLRQSLLSKRLISATLWITALIGLSYGLSYVIIIGLIVGLGPSWLNFGLSYGLSYGLSIGLSYWLLLGLFQGVSSETIKEHHRTVPNQGIHRSAFNGLVFGLISAIIVVLISSLSTGLNQGLEVGLDQGLSIRLWQGLIYSLRIVQKQGLDIGLSVGLLVGLLTGGLACLRHYVLRLLLWRSKSIPWNYSRFLDYATECLLLRKVGGGYIFLHRLLLDYFVALETDPVSDRPVASLQGAPTTPASPSLMPSASPVQSVLPDLPASPPSLAPPTVLSDVPHLLPCGHERRTTTTHFCSVCGAPVSS